MKIFKFILKSIILILGVGIVVGLFFLSKIIYPSVTVAPWFMATSGLIAMCGAVPWLWEVVNDL